MWDSLRVHFQCVWLSGDNIKSLHKVSISCQWCCGCSHVCVGLHNCWNIEFSPPVLYISLTAVVGLVPTSPLRQIVNPYVLLLKTLHAMLYHFGTCAHCPASSVNIALLLRQHCIILIMLVLPILNIIRTCKIAQTVSDSIQCHLRYGVRLSGSCWRVLKICHIFLLMRNFCFIILNSLSCHCGISLHIIHNPFLWLSVAFTVGFPSFLHQELHWDGQVPNAATLGPAVTTSYDCHYILDVDVMGNVSSICRIYTLGMENWDFPQHWAVNLVLTM